MGGFYKWGEYKWWGLQHSVHCSTHCTFIPPPAPRSMLQYSSSRCGAVTPQPSTSPRLMFGSQLGITFAAVQPAASVALASPSYRCRPTPPEFSQSFSAQAQ